MAHHHIEAVCGVEKILGVVEADELNWIVGVVEVECEGIDRGEALSFLDGAYCTVYLHYQMIAQSCDTVYGHAEDTRLFHLATVNVVLHESEIGGEIHVGTIEMHIIERYGLVYI